MSKKLSRWFERHQRGNGGGALGRNGAAARHGCHHDRISPQSGASRHGGRGYGILPLVSPYRYPVTVCSLTVGCLFAV